MKKLILMFCGLAILLSAHSQSFTLSKHLINAEGPNSSSADAICTMTNVSSDNADTAFKWAIIYINAPAQWLMSLCDTKDCYSSLNMGMNKVFYLKNNGSGPLKASADFQNTSGTGSMTIVVTSVKNPSNTDTVVYTWNAWLTGMAELNHNKGMSVYPNPAKDQLTIQYASKEKVTIEIYNVLGAKVKAITTEGPSTTIGVSDLDKGMYFIRMKDGNSISTKSFTKVD